MDIDPSKIAAQPLIAGLAGSLLALRFAPGTSWLERATNVASGSACAAYLAPAAAEVFRLSSQPMMSCLAFALGLFGMSIVSALMIGLREIKVGEIVSGWISKGGPK